MNMDFLILSLLGTDANVAWIQQHFVPDHPYPPKALGIVGDGASSAQAGDD